MAKLSPEDWVQAGINQLKENGPQGISGEQIARRLDVTRGSFYHHFPNMDHYIDRLIQHWERSQTIEVVTRASKNASNKEEQMMLLLESAWNSDAELEISMRQWAFSNDEVRKRVERADQLRLSFIQSMYASLLEDQEQGEKLGKVAYYGLLGALHAWPRFNKADLKSLILEIQALLLSGTKRLH